MTMYIEYVFYQITVDISKMVGPSLEWYTFAIVHQGMSDRISSNWHDPVDPRRNLNHNQI